MNEINVVRKTSGLCNGMRTPDEVGIMFGINVRQWPNLFSITRTGLVVKEKRHERVFKLHIAGVKSNFNALGVR